MNISGLTGPQQYASGDLDLDGDNDFDDFLLFQADYDAVHGSGSLAQLIATPEPTTSLLALLGVMTGAMCRTRRKTL